MQSSRLAAKQKRVKEIKLLAALPGLAQSLKQELITTVDQYSSALGQMITSPSEELTLKISDLERKLNELHEQVRLRGGSSVA